MCRVDAVRSGERERQARERRPAPAGRRPGGVRAQRGLHWSGDLGRETREGAREDVRRVVGAPVEEQLRRPPVGVHEGLLPAGTTQERGRDEDTRLHTPRGRHTRKWQPIHIRESFVDRRWLELAKRTHLGRGCVHARFTACQFSQLLRSRQRSETIEQPLDEVDLRLRERRVEPHAP